jgi:signal transduction histidine kinase/DNA-binding response OmpR family regulator/ligand-binding sensor domain-containing protein
MGSLVSSISFLLRDFIFKRLSYLPGFWSLLLYFVFMPIAQGQLLYESLTVEDGLSQGFISAMEQDHKGFLWFGTYDGLNRYDGYQIKRYTARPYSLYSLQNAYITSIFEDKKGFLWVGTYEGLYVMDPLKERFFYLSIPEYHLPAQMVKSIEGDLDGNLLVAFDQLPQPRAFFEIQTAPSFYTQIRAANTTLTGIKVREIPILSPFTTDLFPIGFVGDSLYFLLDALGKPFYYDRPATQIKPFDPRRFQAYTDMALGILMKKKQQMGIAFRYKSPDGLDQFNTKNAWRYMIPFQDSLFLLCLNFDGLMFLKKDRQPLRSNLNQQAEILQKDPVFMEEFRVVSKAENFTYSCYLVDNGGIIWANTGGFGAHKYNMRKWLFSGLLNNTSASSLRVLGPHHIWVRLYSGKTAVINTQTLQFESAPWEGPAQPKRMVSDVCVDRQGNYWFALAGSHLIKTSQIAHWNTATRQFTLLPDLLPYLEDVPERIFEDRDGNIWIGGHECHLFRIRKGSFAVEKFMLDLKMPGKKNLQRTNVITQTMDGDLWVGTNQGLVQVTSPNTSTPAFRVIQHDEKNLHSLSINWVLSLHQDARNPQTLWIGTRGGGLNKFDMRTQQFTHYTASPEGLPDNVVYGILSDDKGHLWCSTNRGICRFDPDRLTFVVFQQSDGLLSTEYNTHSYLKTSDGRMWFGGVNGLNFFYPEQITTNDLAPKAAITSIKVGGLEYLPDTDSTLCLTYDNNNVIFDFSVLDFSNNITNHYRYRLLGIQKDWVNIGTTHTANFSALRSGKYVFELQGATAGSTWSNTVRFQLEILPPWYRSWAAWCFYICLFMALMYTYIRYRVQHFRLKDEAKISQMESEKLKEFDAVKNRFFANIAHELRTPLTVILGLAARLRRQEHAVETQQYAEKIIQHADTLLSLSDQVLELGKLDSHHIALHPINGLVSSFIARHIEALHPLAIGKGIQLNFQADPSDIQMDFDPTQFPKILNNLVSNAIRHTEAGGMIDVKIVLKNDGSLFEMTVIDTGEGIDPTDLPNVFDRYYQGGRYSGASGASGIGLTLVRELVVLMGGNIRVESDLGEGTTFVVTLPVTQKAPQMIASKMPAPGPSRKQDKLVSSLENTESLALILIVEDNESIIEYLQLCLHPHYRTVVVKDGQTGIDKAVELVPDLILTDIAMPILDGFALCAAVKSHPGTSHIPIIMLSARIDEADRMQGLGLGADAYLTKPFNETELLLLIRNLFQLRKKWQDQFAAVIKDPERSTMDVNHARQPSQDVFMQQLHAVFQENYTDEQFNLEKLCLLIGMSSSQLDRKIKALTNQSPMQMLRLYRLEKAYHLLQQSKQLSISEVCFKVGFKNPSHFSRLFAKEYGKPPSER